MAERLSRIVSARVGDPAAIATAAARRVRASSLLGEHGKAMIIAADHPARG
ncbi:Cgl0159 family (beta/alpha)8-fold protein, partial [Streptomyces sp. NPDC002920]